jgi:hypothetical protein
MMHAQAATTRASTDPPLKVLLAPPVSSTLPPTSWKGAPPLLLPPLPLSLLLLLLLLLAWDVAAALVGLTSAVGCGVLSVVVVCTGAGGGALGAAQTDTLVTPSRLAVGCGRSVVA